MSQTNTDSQGTRTTVGDDYDSDEEHETDQKLAQAFYRQFNLPNPSEQHVSDKASQAKINKCVEETANTNTIRAVLSRLDSLIQREGETTEKKKQWIEMKKRRMDSITRDCIAKIKLDKYLEDELKRDERSSPDIFKNLSESATLGGSRFRRKLFHKTKRENKKRSQTKKRRKKNKSKKIRGRR